MGRDFSPLHAAYCVAGLPLGSRLLAEIDPAYGWTVTDYQLHDIKQMLAGRVIPFPWKRSEQEGTTNGPGLPAFGSMTVEDFEKWRESKDKKI